ncbi:MULTISPECIES: CC0125/CC1285 family lipoprotein [Henriciella]|jgi:hypothetical protein|uniref:CC0125/CC1285 family lipoprotein n=1 Tax=Henriciella TaxID=453849 RepID=UPI00351497E4
MGALRLKIAVLAGSLALTAACASTPTYREAASSRSSGYTDTQIETNRYQVGYRLNDDDVAKAQSLALRRAAELTLQKGFDTFEIVSQSANRDTERERTHHMPGRGDTVVQRNCGLLGCSTTVSRFPDDPFYHDIETERNTTVVMLEIILSDKDASVSPSLYDASEVFANLAD